MEEEKGSVKKVLPIMHDCHNAQYYAVQQTKHTRKLVGWLVDIFRLDHSWDSYAECCQTVATNLQADSEADFFCKIISILYLVHLPLLEGSMTLNH